MIDIPLIFQLLFFACWGSFLNVLGHRLIAGKNLFSRSHCLSCGTTIAWYDLIPILSYLILSGKCRSCGSRISPLYLLVETISIVSFIALVQLIPQEYLISYFIFFSALIVIIRSDLETMLISRFTTLYLVPIGISLSYFHLLPISFTTSIMSSIGGWIGLYLFATIFQIITGKDGMGIGDMDLIAMIGAFTGPFGIWMSLMIGSIAGSIYGITYITITKQSTTTRIPFGPFLAIGAFLYVLSS